MAINGTFPTSINQTGTITGSYLDQNRRNHGFLRTPDGGIRTFNSPGGTHGTLPKSINKSGAITGYYKDVNDILHGFLRATNGSMTSFNAPGSINGTLPASINTSGAIVGYYLDDHFIGHGFLRAPDGTITTFDVPGAINGTYPTSINQAGSRSRDNTLTNTSLTTASYVVQTATSAHSTHRGQSSLSPLALLGRGNDWIRILMRTTNLIASSDSVDQGDCSEQSDTDWN